MSVLTAIATMTGCSQNQETLAWAEVLRDIRNKYPEVKQLQTDELYSWITVPGGGSVILIDARKKEEFQVSHISGARHIPYNRDPSKYLANIKQDDPIVVYCSVGYRSSILAEKLQKMGFTEVHNLEGSLFKWANEGKPVVQGQKMIHKVHPYNAHWGRLLEVGYHPNNSDIEKNDTEGHISP